MKEAYKEFYGLLSFHLEFKAIRHTNIANMDEHGYYDLHPTQASRGLARVKTERMAGRQQVRGVPKTAC